MHPYTRSPIDLENPLHIRRVCSAGRKLSLSLCASGNRYEANKIKSTPVVTARSVNRLPWVNIVSQWFERYTHPAEIHSAV